MDFENAGDVAFAVTWITLGVISFLFFNFSRNARLKRKLWPAFNAVTGTLFVAYVGVKGGRSALSVMGPFMLLITIGNIKLTKFCDSCGAISIRRSLLSPNRYCSKCGEEL